jgi:dynein heavy chain, axonemal
MRIHIHTHLQINSHARTDRMGVDIPDGARIVLFQEDKFKNYHNELHWALSEYDKVVSKVIPVTAMVLRPHFRY